MTKVDWSRRAAEILAEHPLESPPTAPVAPEVLYALEDPEVQHFLEVFPSAKLRPGRPQARPKLE